MEYLKFKNSIKEFPIFSSSHLVNFGENLQTLRNQLTLWQKKGLIVKLKKGPYVLNRDNFKEFLINKMEKIDFAKAKRDVERFLVDKNELRLFNRELLMDVINLKAFI